MNFIDRSTSAARLPVSDLDVRPVYLIRRLRHREVSIVVVNVDFACRLGGIVGRSVGDVLSSRRHEESAPSSADSRRIVRSLTLVRRA